MADTHPNQAMGTGGAGQPDGVDDAPGKSGGVDAPGGGESSGSAYPNPQTGKKQTNGGFMGHGGQTEIAYSGTGQGGEDDDAGVGNANAVTK